MPPLFRARKGSAFWWVSNAKRPCLLCRLRCCGDCGAPSWRPLRQALAPSLSRPRPTAPVAARALSFTHPAHRPRRPPAARLRRTCPRPASRAPLLPRGLFDRRPSCEIYCALGPPPAAHARWPNTRAMHGVACAFVPDFHGVCGDAHLGPGSCLGVAPASR